MNKSDSINEISFSGLTDQTKFRLNEIIEIEDYLNSDIQERKAMSKNLVNEFLLLNILSFEYKL